MGRVGFIGAVLAGALFAGSLLAWRDHDSPAAVGDACSEGDSLWTTDTLRDWVSFADGLAVITPVAERETPPPAGPEGYAGYIGRRVTVRVERRLWRRRGASAAPDTFRFVDYGWVGTIEDRRPARACGGARLELGRRYLAPLVRHRGEWFPFGDGRLVLDRDLVVGGVDVGEPSLAHHALAGRRIEGAAAIVAATRPYRAAVRYRHLNAARRWQQVDRDRYRVWRGRPGTPVEVARGVTTRARWLLYARRRAGRGLCVGMRARPLWGGGRSPGVEECGAGPTTGTTLGVFSAADLGVFAYGWASRYVVWVRARFDGERTAETQTLPRPPGLGGRERFWVVPAEGDCPVVRIRALDRRRRLVEEQTSPPDGSEGCR
jgi:hypothetical protein